MDPAGSAPAVVTRYLFAAAGDAAWGQTVDTALTRSVGLPGGVSWTNQAGTVTWSFPNLAGHGLMTRAGGTNGALLLWDPFGQPVDPVTFAVGTAASNDTGQVAGNTLWHQGALKPAESVGSTLVVEMGVRLYVPALGRFLQVDPIEGGGANDYSWHTDPINGHDLTGKKWAIAPAKELGRPTNPGKASRQNWGTPVFTKKPTTQNPSLTSLARPASASPAPASRPAWGPLVEWHPENKGSMDLGISGCLGACLNLSFGHNGSGRVGVGFGLKAGVGVTLGASTETGGGYYMGGSCNASAGAAGLYVEGGIQENGPPDYVGVGGSWGAGIGCSADVGWGW